MRELLKGRKSYLIAAVVIAVGVYGVASGEMSITEGIDYVLGGGALATVRAAIAKHPDIVLRVTDHHDWLIGNGSGEVIADIGDLAGMADVIPSARENPFDLQLKQRRIRIHAAMHAVRKDQRLDPLCSEVRH